VPFNIFGGQGANGDGTITQEMLDYVTFVEHDVSEQTLVDVVANIAGEIVKLPAGALSIAAGLEHRRLSGFYEPDAVVAAGDGADVPSKPTSGDYWVNEAYAELRVPVLAGLPGAELVDLSAAGRVSDYSILEPEVTGKLGARWKPMKDLMLRGSYARGFRAPGIGELFGSESRYDAMLNDPCSNFNEQGVSQAIRDRCIALGVPGDGSYEQLNPQISVATGGNIELEPETSDSVTISLAYSPEWLQGQSWVDRLDLELAYYDIHVDGAIAPLDAQLQLDRCVGGDETLCEGITRTSQGSINGFANKLQNLGGFSWRGHQPDLRDAGQRGRPLPRHLAVEPAHRLLGEDPDLRRLRHHRARGSGGRRAGARLPALQVVAGARLVLPDHRGHVHHALHPQGGRAVP
jgi:iron complex outermembrane receptor protein